MGSWATQVTTKDEILDAVIHRRLTNTSSIFMNFDFDKVAKLTDADVERSLKNEGIGRHQRLVVGAR